MRQIVQDRQRHEIGMAKYCANCKFYSKADDYCYFWSDSADSLGMLCFTCFVPKKADNV